MEIKNLIQKIKEIDVKAIFLIILSFFLLVVSISLFFSFISSFFTSSYTKNYYFTPIYSGNYDYKIIVKANPNKVLGYLSNFGNFTFYNYGERTFLVLNLTASQKDKLINYLTKNFDAKVVYATFTKKDYYLIALDVKENKIVDVKKLKEEWVYSLKELIEVFNRTLIDLTIGFPIFLIKLVKLIIYAYITFLIAIFSLKLFKKSLFKIWKN